MTMKLQFTHQDYQTRAVEAVVKVFDGQPLAQVVFRDVTQLKDLITDTHPRPKPV